VARPDRTILVGAGGSGRGWAAHLRANPVVTFSVKGRERRYRAQLVGPHEREAALAELRATMGGIAERADWADLFVLRPEAAEES